MKHIHHRSISSHGFRNINGKPHFFAYVEKVPVNTKEVKFRQDISEPNGTDGLIEVKESKSRCSCLG